MPQESQKRFSSGLSCPQAKGAEGSFSPFSGAISHSYTKSCFLSVCTWSYASESALSSVPIPVLPFPQRLLCLRSPVPSAGRVAVQHPGRTGFGVWVQPSALRWLGRAVPALHEAGARGLRPSVPPLVSLSQRARPPRSQIASCLPPLFFGAEDRTGRRNTRQGVGELVTDR